MIRFGRVRFGLILLGVMIAGLAMPLLARADNVVEGFYEKGKLKTGQIVKLSTKPPATVEVAPANTSNQIFGVVVDASRAPITLERQNQQVFIATGGSYPVFVTTQNGPINKGDYISMSQIDGVGAKATGNQPLVLGHAEATFDGKNNVLSHSDKYAIGQIMVALSVLPNTQFKNTLAIPQPLQRLGNSISGREVPPFRVYMALILFLVAISLAVILLIVGTRSSLVALGRNPLSRHSILQGMFQVIAVAVTIFGISVGGVYLLLRL